MNDIKNLIKWFIRNNETLKNIGFDEKIKLQKLLYYAQAMHYAVFDTPLFSEKIEAWLHGPVVPAAYYAHEYTSLLEDAVCTSKKDIDSLFTDKVKSILNVVNYVYGSKTGKELEQISHEEEPWIKYKAQLNQRPNPEIKRDDIKSYYLPLKEVYEAFNDFDFTNKTTQHINSNNFIYNFKEMELNDDDVLNLWMIGETSREKSYYVRKNDDGIIEVIQ